MRCRRCSLIRLDRFPTPEELAQLYSTERYFRNPDFYAGSPERFFGYEDAGAETDLKYLLYARLLRPVVRQTFPSPAGRSWLDVGSGLGSLVDFARREGFAAQGIEPNPAALERARAAYGDHFLPGWIETVRLERTFDVITLIDVVEHVLDPRACLAWVRQHLAEPGIAIVVTMDCRSLPSRLLGNRLEDFRRIREHIHFFGRANFRMLAEYCGMRAVAIRSWGGYFHGRQLAQRVCAMAGIPPRAAQRLAAALVPARATPYVDPRVKMMIVLRRAA